MVRFMTINNTKNIPKTRIYYYTWYLLFYSLTILAAFIARLLIPEIDSIDPELALPTLALNLLPEFFVGIVLAGIFAATMSTADSQILACTASVTNDILSKKNNYLINKFVTLIVTVFVVIIAIKGDKNVFNLVLMSWSTLACCFSPLLIINALKQKVSEFLSIIMMVTPLITLLLWRYFELNYIIYEVAPGILSGIFAFFIFRVLRK